MSDSAKKAFILELMERSPKIAGGYQVDLIGIFAEVNGTSYEEEYQKMHEKEDGAALLPADPSASPASTEALSNGADVFIADDICERLRPLRNRLDEMAASATKEHSGSGGWWELSGYAEILDEAMKRIRLHRNRVEGVDRQIARERAVR